MLISTGLSFLEQVMKYAEAPNGQILQEGIRLDLSLS